MDRAEVLHAPSYDLELIGKIRPSKTNWWKYLKNQFFRPIFTLAASGEPSTWFPPEGLVETAGANEHARNLHSSRFQRWIFDLSSLLCTTFNGE